MTTTKEAFLQMLASKELTEQLNLKPNTIRMYKSRAERNAISLNTMEQMLFSAGLTKIPEIWELKSKK